MKYLLKLASPAGLLQSLAKCNRIKRAVFKFGNYLGEEGCLLQILKSCSDFVANETGSVAKPFSCLKSVWPYGNNNKNKTDKARN